ncbi:MAG: RIP metalloprotease RseP [Dehalococcoidia bacterium]|nr:RIP metalloprotease RseP [Dehalococcoidia bacterium]
MPYIDTALSILTFLGVLIVLVLIHEVGHYVTARLAGVQVVEFGFGYPPRLFAIKRGGTEYSFNILPLGGFVKLVGEEDPTHPRSLARQPAWVRAIILAAGAVMNALLPVLLFTITAMVPQSSISGDVRILAVAPNSPAERAGLRPGDVVQKIAGETINRSAELSYLIQINLGNPLQFVVRRDGEAKTLSGIVPRFNPPQGQGATGIIIRTGDLTVQDVAAGSPAAAVGLRPGDSIIQVNGEPLTTARAPLAALAQETHGDTSRGLDFLVERNGKFQTVGGTLDKVPAAPGLAGIGLTMREANVRSVVLSKPFLEAVPYGVQRSVETLVLAKNTIVTWVSGTTAPQFAGPVGIAQMTGEVASLGGILALMELAALLSMNMAFFNILPIPMLDGGRLLFVVIEVVRGGKRISPQREGFVHMVGFAVLIAMIVVVTYFDIARLVRGESLLR